MICRGVRICIPALVVSALSIGPACAQGVSGDGIPDVYYWVDDGAVAPNGEVRTAGYLQVDTDGNQFDGVLVGSPTDFSEPGVCLLCDGGPICCIFPGGSPWFYTVGYYQGYTLWLRTFPLVGSGPVGIFDLADDESGGAIFPPNPRLGNSSVLFGSYGQSFHFDVTLVRVPEPGTSALLCLGCLALLLFRRRTGQ